MHDVKLYDECLEEKEYGPMTDIGQRKLPELGGGRVGL